MSGSVKRLRTLPLPQRVAAVMAIALQFGLFVAAELDIQRRPAAEIRGGKGRWRVISLLNFVGPLLYFCCGRTGRCGCGRSCKCGGRCGRRAARRCHR
jgi:hypothetical protein